MLGRRPYASKGLDGTSGSSTQVGVNLKMLVAPGLIFQVTFGSASGKSLGKVRFRISNSLGY